MTPGSILTVLLRKAARFKESDFTFDVEITFVADENNDDVRAGERARV